jgi:branched-chain amino acid transport system ATP-binding protein
MQKTFGGIVALRDVSLEVRCGEMTAITGGNGSGKTTLLNLLAGMIKCDRGHVRWNGRDITRFNSIRRCALGIARTFQIPRPFSRMTAWENVLVAANSHRWKTKHAEQDARDALHFVGLTDKAEWNAEALTWVESRLLELARAMATNPRVLLIDEVFAGLHEERIPQMIALFSRLREQGLGLVVIEHRSHYLESVADHQYILGNGVLTAHAPASRQPGASS